MIKYQKRDILKGEGGLAMPVFRLDKNEISFPDPRLAREDGLLAVGGDLSVERLLLAYTHGIFPWFNPGEEILWWSPHRRYLIFLKIFIYQNL